MNLVILLLFLVIVCCFANNFEGFNDNSKININNLDFRFYNHYRLRPDLSDAYFSVEIMPRELYEIMNLRLYVGNPFYIKDELTDRWLDIIDKRYIDYNSDKSTPPPESWVLPVDDKHFYIYQSSGYSKIYHYLVADKNEYKLSSTLDRNKATLFYQE